MSNEQTVEDDLDAALAAFDKDPLPTATAPEPEHGEGQPAATPTPAASQFTPEAMSAGSPTLDALDKQRRPKEPTVCTGCPNSVWFATQTEVKCYCRVMFLVTWSNKEPQAMLHCDGLYIGQE